MLQLATGRFGRGLLMAPNGFLLRQTRFVVRRKLSSRAPGQTEKDWRWKAMKLTGGLLTSCAALYQAYIFGVANAPQYQKDAFQVLEAKNKVLTALSRTESEFKDDLWYEPYFVDLPLELALKSEITREKRVPGVVIVLCPKESGKTTRMARVVRTLKQSGAISGGLQINALDVLDKDQNVLQALSESVNGPPKAKFWDLLPTDQSKKIVLILDNVDSIVQGNTKNTASMIKRLKDLSHQLAMHSVKFNFEVYVLTSDPETARELLELNGGEKVRLLAYGTEIAGGNDTTGIPGSWRANGLKLQKEDIEKMIDAFELSLDDEARSRFIALGIESGTPGFIQTVASKMKQAGLTDPLQRIEFLNQFNDYARRHSIEWQECAKVQKRKTE